MKLVRVVSHKIGDIFINFVVLCKYIIYFIIISTVSKFLLKKKQILLSLSIIWMYLIVILPKMNTFKSIHMILFDDLKQWLLYSLLITKWSVLRDHPFHPSDDKTWSASRDHTWQQGMVCFDKPHLLTTIYSFSGPMVSQRIFIIYNEELFKVV